MERGRGHGMEGVYDDGEDRMRVGRECLIFV